MARRSEKHTHMQKYGKKTKDRKNRKDCMYYENTKICPNYCNLNKDTCRGVTYCDCYNKPFKTEKFIEPKQKIVVKEEKKKPAESIMGKSVTHINFGDGIVVDDYNNEKTYILIEFLKDQKQRKIPFPDSVVNGELTIIK